MSTSVNPNRNPGQPQGGGGETILVIDDTVINLKVIAATLRSDGYRVHLASTAEQGLMTLRTMRPDLILVDIQLPGMSGLEFTRQVKANPSTEHIVVVALTASVDRDSQQRAYDAGCDGFIGKPIDTRTIGSRVRAYLQGDAAPESLEEGTESPAGLAFSGPEMEGLRRKFLAESSREVRRILEFLNVRVDAAATARLFHQWIGSAGALGYNEIAERARAAETLLNIQGWTKAALREHLEALAQALSKPSEVAHTPIPADILQQVRGRRVALIGFGDEEADKICEALESARALPRMFGADEPVDSEAFRDCSVAIVHVRPETLASAWLSPASAPSALPLMLLGAREHILGLDPQVQSRAFEYLIDGWQPEESVMRLSFALSRAEAHRLLHDGTEDGRGLAGRSDVSKGGDKATQPPAANPGILIADDDSHVVSLVGATLNRLGMEFRTASDGVEALRIIREIRPRAAVLDVNMPGLDGFEVLAAIRQAALPVKVILLTARQQEADILRGFQLGADDYVVKPFNPLELAARLKRLL